MCDHMHANAVAHVDRVCGVSIHGWAEVPNMNRIGTMIIPDGDIASVYGDEDGATLDSVSDIVTIHIIAGSKSSTRSSTIPGTFVGRTSNSRINEYHPTKLNQSIGN